MVSWGSWEWNPTAKQSSQVQEKTTGHETRRMEKQHHDKEEPALNPGICGRHADITRTSGRQIRRMRVVGGRSRAKLSLIGPLSGIDSLCWCTAKLHETIR